MSQIEHTVFEYCRDQAVYQIPKQLTNQENYTGAAVSIALFPLYALLLSIFI